MSLLLALFSIGLGASLVKEVAKDVTKIPARSQMQEDSKNGNFDVIKNFENILYVCDVKRKKHNSSVAVLPYDGYLKCLNYIADHHLTTLADEQRFINHYKKVLASEISQRQVEYDKRYLEVKSKVKSMMSSGNYEVVRYEHIDVFVDYEEVEMKVKAICNTFLGDFQIGEVKIKENSSGNSFTEIWALRIPVGMKFSLKRYYMACARKCGYIY